MPASTRALAPWEDFALRTIAVFKLAKALLFIAIGIGLLRLMHHNVEEILRYYVIEPMHFDPENRLLKGILDQAADLTRRKIEIISFGTFFYAAVFATEGTGLYLRKSWAEYMVLISTGALLPVELYEVLIGFAWWKLGIITTNLAILFYLVHRLLLDSRNAARESDDENRSDDDDKQPPPDRSSSSSEDSGMFAGKAP
jgi:uncharacterized membrane protein (DUF2068 family)